MSPEPKLDLFIEKYNHLDENLNLIHITELAKKLININLPFQVCKLLEKHIPNSDLWASELTIIYIDALLRAQQFKTLFSTLNKINTEEESRYFLNVAARCYEQMGDFDNALTIIQTSLSKYKDSELYLEFIRLLEYSEKPEQELVNNINQIPEEILHSPSEVNLNLIIYISKFGNYKISEKMIIKWYVDNYEKAIPLISRFHIATLTNAKKLPNLDISTPQFIAAYTCKRNGQDFIYLLSNQLSNTKNPHILSPTSKYGQILKEEKDNIPIKSIERIPVLLAIQLISIETQGNIEKGDGFFETFNIEDQSLDQIKQFLVQEIQRNDIPNDRLKYICKNSELFFATKIRALNNNGIVDSALHHLTSSGTFKHPLPNFGERELSCLLLDIHTVLHLSLSNLAESLMQSNKDVYLTHQTKILLTDWINKLETSDGGTLSIDKKSKIIFQTHLEKKKYLEPVINQIKIILKSSATIFPKLDNTSIDILLKENILDISTYSCLIVSSSKNIPWLCIDPVMSAFASTVDCTIVNAEFFYSILAQNVDINDKKEALQLHLNAQLPWCFTLKEAIDLTTSHKTTDLTLLTSLLEKYTKTALFCTEISPLIEKIAFITLIRILNLDARLSYEAKVEDIHYIAATEKLFFILFRAILRIQNDKQAEEKFAIFLYNSIRLFPCTPRTRTFLTNIIEKFLQGHFLDRNHVLDTLHNLSSTK